MKRPPDDITPTEFFERWLQAQIPAGTATATAITVRVKLDGEGGGAWDLALGPSGLTVTAAAAGPAEVTISQSVDDWRAFLVGEAGGSSLAPPQVAATDLLFLDRTAQQVIAQVKGILRFEVTGYHGRTWKLLVAIGKDGTAPDATISVDAETYAQILARTLPAPQAFFSGKLNITGDVNLAMLLGMALMPRFN